MFDLHGKIALVTGASRGIGKSIALCLAQQGADVIINCRSNEQLAREAAAEIEKMGRRAMAIQADVCDENAVGDMFEKIMREFGRLDILVNNAGTTKSQNIFDTDFADWKRILDVNLDSTFLCSKAAMEIMREQNVGRIICISSQSGVQGALAGPVHYSAAKGGVNAFIKALARTAAPYRVTVNAIAPGVIDAGLSTGVSNNKELERQIPLGYGTAEDVAAAVCYLASDEARYVTGVTLDVNGGFCMR